MVAVLLVLVLAAAAAREVPGQLKQPFCVDARNFFDALSAAPLSAQSSTQVRREKETGVQVQEYPTVNASLSIGPLPAIESVVTIIAPSLLLSTGLVAEKGVTAEIFGDAQLLTAVIYIENLKLDVIWWFVGGLLVGQAILGYLGFVLGRKLRASVFPLYEFNYWACRCGAENAFGVFCFQCGAHSAGNRQQ
eukprot:TRINITY_DN239_c0_g1_i1.p1 TRINITY_DN239_c0_g1~~TRINITY_DN239_c0_g1_i1.p1  ORF type:complete len:211 (+),score=42.58 TRINITY_DN239_c0_g1_i1:60-635(+)